MSTFKMPKISKPLSDTEIKNAKYTTDEEFELLKKEIKQKPLTIENQNINILKRKKNCFNGMLIG